jgi:predicted negative regulator of RcsB-dependent stress response
MAIYDLEEQEKIDALKGWWKENGRLVLLTLAACIIAIAAVNAWRWHQRTQAEQAAEMFATISELSGKENAGKIQETAAQLRDKYASTGYASRAALKSAEASFSIRDLARARNDLKWVIDKTDEQGLRDIARLRLAAVALDEKKYDEAMKLLNTEHENAFDGLYLELKGDVLVAQDKIEEARTAYSESLKKIQGDYRGIIEAKRDALGEAE